VLRNLLEKALDQMVSEDPDLALTQLDEIQEFVDKIIAFATACNQSPQMVDLATTIIQTDLTPAQVRVIKNALGDFRGSVSCGGDPGLLVPNNIQRWHKTFIKMGKIWKGLREAFGTDRVWGVGEDADTPGGGGGTRA
jgi:hypothetical protein